MDCVSSAVNATEADRATIGEFSISASHPKEYAAVVALLLRAGADVECTGKGAMAAHGRTWPLYEAVGGSRRVGAFEHDQGRLETLQIVQSLIQAGADVNRVIDAPKEEICTALLRSIWGRADIEFVEALLDGGADPNKGHTCLLTRPAQLKHPNGVTPLQVAVMQCGKHKQPEDLNLLKVHKKQLGDTLSIVDALLRAGADPNAAPSIDDFANPEMITRTRHELALTPLQIALSLRREDWAVRPKGHFISKADQKEIVQMLLEAGAKVDPVSAEKMERFEYG